MSASLSTRQIWNVIQHDGPNHLGLWFNSPCVSGPVVVSVNSEFLVGSIEGLTEEAGLTKNFVGDLHTHSAWPMHSRGHCGAPDATTVEMA